MRQESMMRLLLMVFMCAVFSAAPAWAYIDPGTGSLLLQGVIAAIAGVLGAVSLYWKRVRGWFASIRRRGKPPTAP